MVRAVAFVSVSELLSAVLIRFIAIISVSHQSCRTKFLISICRVRFVGCCADAIRSDPRLSSKRTVASSWGIPISLRIDRKYRIYFPASTAAINSASVELRAIVSWNRALHSTAAPASLITIPVTDLRCWESPAQSESLIPNRVLQDGWCRVTMDFSS